MKASNSFLRWAILSALVIGIILVRIYRGEWLHGKNPLLIFVFLIALYLAWSYSKNKT